MPNRLLNNFVISKENINYEMKMNRIGKIPIDSKTAVMVEKLISRIKLDSNVTLLVGDKILLSKGKSDIEIMADLIPFKYRLYNKTLNVNEEYISGIFENFNDSVNIIVLCDLFDKNNSSILEGDFSDTGMLNIRGVKQFIPNKSRDALYDWEMVLLKAKKYGYSRVPLNILGLLLSSLIVYVNYISSNSEIYLKLELLNNNEKEGSESSCISLYKAGNVLYKMWLDEKDFCMKIEGSDDVKILDTLIDDTRNTLNDINWFLKGIDILEFSYGGESWSRDLCIRNSKLVKEQGKFILKL